MCNEIENKIIQVKTIYPLGQLALFGISNGDIQGLNPPSPLKMY